MREFCLKLFNGCFIVTRHCISEYRETFNSKQKMNAHKSTATNNTSTEEITKAKNHTESRPVASFTNMD